MPASIDRATLQHVAKLASLSLSEEESRQLTADLARIVAYVDELAGVDTGDLAPTAHVQLDRLPLRADEPRPGLSHEAALAQAPRAEQGGFAVPVFVDGGAGTKRSEP